MLVSIFDGAVIFFCLDFSFLINLWIDATSNGPRDIESKFTASNMVGNLAAIGNKAGTSRGATSTARYSVTVFKKATREQGTIIRDPWDGAGMSSEINCIVTFDIAG
jgi:hypothetical protein